MHAFRFLSAGAALALVLLVLSGPAVADAPDNVKERREQHRAFGVVTANDLDEVRKQIDKVYAEGDFVGSLVVVTQTGPTEDDGDKVAPPDGWERFWADDHKQTGMTRSEVVVQLRKEKVDHNWAPLTEVALRADAERFAGSLPGMTLSETTPQVDDEPATPETTPTWWWSRPHAWGAAGGVLLLAVLGWLVLGAA